MDQLHPELDFHATDFAHQVEQPGTTTELSSHNGDAANGESAPGFSGDVAPASDPADEFALAEDVLASTAVDDTAALAVEDMAALPVEAASSGPVKRKRGRPRKNPEARVAPLVRKKETENVCFVCFDPTNPNLVSCSRRGCYKAYHPACVNRDEDFFRSKVKWNCGWHMCSNCQKAAHYMCYTCTTSFCKECITDESKYVSVRGTYGFCQSCHNTVTLIEQNKLAFENKVDSDFDDTDSFTYLFKAYWLNQKEKLSLTSEELINARHPCSVAVDEESSDELYDVNDDHGSSSESSSGHHKINISSRRKTKSRSQAFTVDKIPSKEVDGGGTVILPETGWASKDLLELVGHMRNGDQSFISQFEVQALLLDYIKKYNLRDPRRKSQIICDLRLRNLFGKERVGHFEMLKLLELHFISKEVQVFADGDQVEASDPDIKLTDDVEEGDTFTRLVSEKRRKNRKRIEDTEPQANVDDYAAIDIHNITLIFLRRCLVEELLNDLETFNDKVVGSFVRIRISNAGQRQDLYRLVQVVGTQENLKPYKVGKKTTGIVLEILNLDKKETSTIDTISNQDFTEEECQRLRQSIKCGLIDRLKVGYMLEKAKVLHAVRVNDSIEAEKLRLSHLRDRASETGRRKQLRECVEKLQLLNNPDERRRRLIEVPQIHADPKMDPEYESLEEAEDDKNQDSQIKSNEAFSLRKRRELIPRGRAGNNWNDVHRSPKFNHDSSRRMLGEFGQDRSVPNEALLSQSKELYQSEATYTDLQAPSPRNFPPKAAQQPHNTALEINPATPNETDKVWFYVDPSNNIQGPFSLTQLRKWSTTGYFPPDMRVWRTAEKQEDSILLTDVLSGRFYTQHTSFPHQPNRGNWNPHQNANQPTLDGLPSQSPGWSQKPAGPMYHNPYHNPALEESGRGGSNGERNQEQDYANLWSPTRPRDAVTLDPTFANERNNSINKYRTFESDCPSPTPRTENLEINHEFADPRGTSNVNSAEASRDEFPRTGIPNLDVSKPASFQHPSNLSPVEAASGDIGVRMDQPSFQKQFPMVSSLVPPSSHDQMQNPNPNFSPIHLQPNPHNAVQVDSSLPSPTPKSNNHTWGIDPSVPSQTVQLQNANASWGGPPQGNPSWGPQANSGWGTPGPMHTNLNPGWNAPPIQMNVNANPGWRAPVAPVQMNANTNASWGAPPQGNVNSNMGWGNTNPNSGWGIPVQANPSGWGTGSTIEATPHEEDVNLRAGWRSSFGNRNGGWKSSDSETSRRFDHERRNGDGYTHMGRRGGSDPRSNRSMPGGRGGEGGDGRRGVCRFYENGHCKKGTSCQYLHTDLKRDVR